MADCIFCRIAQKEIPANVIFEDEEVIAFYDLEPQAPFHALVIPKKHIKCVSELKEEDKALVGHILCQVIPQIASEHNLDKGFRVVTNNGQEGGQTVGHLHFHVLGGRSMQWPPG